MAHNRILRLIVDGEYHAAAEWMIKIRRPSVFTNGDKLRKAKTVERCAIALGSNYKRFQYLRESGYSPLDIADKAYEQTLEDCQSIIPETTKSLHERLNDDKEL